MSETDLDAIRGAVAEAVHGSQCECGRAYTAHIQGAAEAYEGLADAAIGVVAPLLAEVERLKANQQPDPPRADSLPTPQPSTLRPDQPTRETK